MEQGQALRAARAKLKMTQSILAGASGLSERTVMRAEKGRPVSAENLRSLCAVLGLDAADLVRTEASAAPPAQEALQPPSAAHEPPCVALPPSPERTVRRAVPGRWALAAAAAVLLAVGAGATASGPSLSVRWKPSATTDVGGVEEVEVTRWTTTAVMHALTYDFAAWRRQQEAASAAFSPTGWSGFRSTFRADAALEAVVRDRLVVSSAPTAAPFVVVSGQRSGRPAWKLLVPLVVTFQGSASQRTETPRAFVTVTRRTDRPDAPLEIVAVDPA